MASGTASAGEPFRLGINMAGAVSAGAYTAGVLDFLTEALDEWYAAKARGETVPAHDVMIEVFSGASAGGMCAAISAVMLQQKFDHIHQTNTSDGSHVTGTTNRFYESWVNRIDISKLLQTEDLTTAPPVVSLLDCSIIDEIAEYALAPVEPLPPPRPYVSPSLTLFLSLTNLRGVPYSLNDAAPGSIEESASFFADRIRFETVRNGSPSAPSAHGIDIAAHGAAGGWELLKTAAKATGAFPVFLAPRILPRNFDEYCPAGWESVASAKPAAGVKPAFPADLPNPFPTLNVDGGVTNNDPFNFAHDYLASLGTPSPNNRNPRTPSEANRAVVNIAPFPTTQAYASNFDPVGSRSIFFALPRLLSALIAQSRFFGESLADLMGGDTFSRFVIAPSDDANDQARAAAGKPPQPALQCASLAAFGGFFERDFRAHDFMLGRRNCQKFLYDYFLLPIDNPIIADGLARLTPKQRDEVLHHFGRPEPGDFAGLPKNPDQKTVAWLPIIPLCAPSVAELMTKPIPRVQIARPKLDKIASLLLARFRGVASVGIGHIPSFWLRAFLRPGPFAIALLAHGGLLKTLIDQLGDDCQP
jgi:predicted acylesterase/phospholipase RssA